MGAQKDRVFPTSGQTRVLRALAFRCEPCATVSEVADAYNAMNEGSVSIQLKQLVNLGFVTMEKSTGQGRANLYTVTPIGRSLATLAKELGIGDME